MKSVEILHKEHHLIRHLLEALEALIRETERSGRLPEEVAGELMKLFEAFADGTHQEKEERFFFAKLLQKANEEEAERIQGLLRDHKGERQRMMSMWSHLTSAMFGEPISVREFLRDANDYLKFHREHMTHENLFVLPMGDRLLTAADDAAIVEGFGTIDRDAASSGIEERIRHTCKALGVGLEAGGSSS